MSDQHSASPAPPRRPRPVPVASIHNHVNLYRDPKDPNTGPVTRNEQIHAIERFIRWHERQVAIGRELLAQLQRAEVGAAADEIVRNAGGRTA